MTIRIFNLFIVIILLFLFRENNILSQQAHMEWIERWDDSLHLNDNNSWIATDALGNVFTSGNSSDGASCTTIKYSSTGVQQWAVSYQGDPQISCQGIVVDQVGNSYVTAQYGTFFPKHFQYLLLKFNSEGVLKWSRTYGDKSHVNCVVNMILDKDGNLYEVGETNDDDQNTKILTVKYSPLGDTIWTRHYMYQQNNCNIANSIAIDSSNNLVITGSICWNSYSSNGALLLKYSSSGNLLWEVNYKTGENAGDYFSKVGVDGNNNIYVTGGADYNNGFTEYLTIKYDASGNQQWLRTYSSSSIMGNSNSLTIDNNSNVYVTGLLYYTACSKIVTIKYDPDGDTVWINKHNGFDHACHAFNIISDKGYIYINGYCDTTGNNTFIISTIKYNADNGNEQWEMNYPGRLSDNTKSIAMDNNYNVYVIGYNSLDNTEADFITIKYSQQSTGVNHNNNGTPSKFGLSQNYPNPFNPVTKIDYQIPQSENVTIMVFDILGKSVKTLVNERQNAGYHTINFDGINLSSGIYFYKIEAGSFNDVKKMVLVK